MSIKQVIKYIELKSQLGPEELYLAESFASMTEADKQALMDMWGMKSKPAKPVTRRVIEKCATEGCGLTRRAAVHKNATVDGYHEFQSPKPKSARASSIAERISGTSARSITGLPDGAGNGLLCTFSIDGKVCHGSENDGIHDRTMGYGGYHEFQPATSEQTTAVAGRD